MQPATFAKMTTGLSVIFVPDEVFLNYLKSPEAVNRYKSLTGCKATIVSVRFVPKYLNSFDAAFDEALFDIKFVGSDTVDTGIDGALLKII